MTGVLLVLQSSVSCWAGRNATGTPDLLDCALADIVSPFGEPLFGVFAAAFVMLPFWLASDGDLAITGIAALAVGSVMIPVLPADYAGLAKVVMFLGLVAALLAVANRYLMDSGI